MDIMLVCCWWLVWGWLGHPCCVRCRITNTGSLPLLSDLDILCEMEHEGHTNPMATRMVAFAFVFISFQKRLILSTFFMGARFLMCE